MGRAILIIGAGALLVGIWIYGCIDAARANTTEVRTLPKAMWVLITLLVPVIGCLLWLAFGRARAVKSKGGTAPSGYRAPDDDEDYLRFLEQKERRLRESRQKDEKPHDNEDDENR